MMDQLANFDWIEVIGWIASGLTVATYAMNTMLPLRILAVGSSVFFLIYGLILHVWPLVGMEALLLPINSYRLWQLISLRNRLGRPGDGEPADYSVIKRYGKRRVVPAGTLIFERGDTVDQLYLIGSGKVSIEELNIDIAPGDIFGEIAFFTDAAIRTASARATEDTELFELDEKHFMRLQFEDPSFGLSVMRSVTRRMAERGPAPTAPEGEASAQAS